MFYIKKSTAYIEIPRGNRCVVSGYPQVIQEGEKNYVIYNINKPSFLLHQEAIGSLL